MKAVAQGSELVLFPFSLKNRKNSYGINISVSALTVWVGISGATNDYPKQFEHCINISSCQPQLHVYAYKHLLTSLPACTLDFICLIRWYLSLHENVHSSHFTGLSPVCDLRCLWKWSFLPVWYPHVSHVNNLSRAILHSVTTTHIQKLNVTD